MTCRGNSCRIASAEFKAGRWLNAARRQGSSSPKDDFSGCYSSKWLEFEMKDVQNHIGPPVQQHNVGANDDVGAIGRRRRQSSFEVRRAGLDALLQSGRERSATNELPLKAGGQLIPFGEPGRQTGAMFFVPVVHLIPVVIAIGAVSIIAIVIMTASVSLAMPIPAALRERKVSARRKDSQGTGTEPSSRLHEIASEIRR